MLKSMKSITVILLISFVAVFFAGCGNSARDSALVGAVIGTGIGAIAGGDGTSMLIGGTIGSGIGYWLGSQQEQNETVAVRNQELNSLSAQKNSKTVWIENSNGSRTPVRITRSGTDYIGPNNEHYASLPTEQQLRSAYGF